MSSVTLKKLSAGFAGVLFVALWVGLVPGAVLQALAATGATSRVSVDSSGAQSNGMSYGNAISADGRYVAFASDADNLVSEDTNGTVDVFVHDRQTGIT
jgi:hypothetical protein